MDNARPLPAMMVVGELNVDLILRDLNALPELETERIASGMTMTLGSSSAILSANAAALGLPIHFVGRVGNDSFGRFVCKQLSHRRVALDHVIQDEDHDTGVTVIYTSGAKRGAMTYPGAMTMLTIDDIPLQLMTRCQHLHLSSYYLQAGMRPHCTDLFRRAKESGLSTSLDTNWDPTEQWGSDVLDVLPYVDVFLPNDDEAKKISGTDELEPAIARLSELADTVVVTCGSEGVVARRGEQQFRCPAIEVDVVDAVGAGDSFNAGFLCRYLLGDDLASCLKAGLVSGAFSVTAAGGIAAFDDRQRFAEFASRNGVQLPLSDCSYSPSKFSSEVSRA